MKPKELMEMVDMAKNAKATRNMNDSNIDDLARILGDGESIQPLDGEPF